MIRRLGSPGFHGIGGIGVADMGAACPGGAAVPWSLSYDGSDDETDCGNGASIMGLGVGPFTVDIYTQLPTAPWAWGTPISQGVTYTTGWTLNMLHTTGTGLLYAAESNAARAQSGIVAFTALNWYYWRVRATRAGGNVTVYVSCNAGAELSNTNNYLGASAEHLWMGRLGGGTHQHFTGKICYVHIWNTDKGALGAVPTSPFAVDANTVGRWIHSEGAGATLGDTSGNLNNGTISGATWSNVVPAGWTI